MTEKVEALLLTKESVEIFAAFTNYTEARLERVLEQNVGLRYVLVTGLDVKHYPGRWSFMDDHTFRSMWRPVSEINGEEFVEVRRKGY